MSVKIDQALVQAVIDGNFNLSIAHENIVFDPSPGYAHMIVEIIRNPADPITMGSGGTDETTGILQCRIRYPVDTGAIVAKQKADDLLAYFRIGRVFTYSGQRVQIMSKDRGSGRIDEGWYQLVTRFVFEARTQRNAA